MKTDTKDKLIKIIDKTGKSRPSELALELGVSLQMIHRHLKDLVAKGVLQKIGLPPLTFYELKETNRIEHQFKDKKLHSVVMLGTTNYMKI